MTPLPNPLFSAGKAPPLRTEPSSFEEQVRRLGLRESDYIASRELRDWCCRNANRRYIPEWLLKQWGIDVDPNVS